MAGGSMSTDTLEGGAISYEMVERIRESRDALSREQLVPIPGMASYFVSASNGEKQGYGYAFNVPVDGTTYYIYIKQ